MLLLPGATVARNDGAACADFLGQEIAELLRPRIAESEAVKHVLKPLKHDLKRILSSSSRPGFPSVPVLSPALSADVAPAHTRPDGQA